MTDKIFLNDKECIDFLDENMYADSETKTSYIILDNLERFRDRDSKEDVYDKIRISYHEETLEF